MPQSSKTIHDIFVNQIKATISRNFKVNLASSQNWIGINLYDPNNLFPLDIKVATHKQITQKSIDQAKEHKRENQKPAVIYDFHTIPKISMNLNDFIELIRNKKLDKIIRDKPLTPYKALPDKNINRL